MAIEREEIERLAKDRDDELQILDRNVYARLKQALIGKEAAKGPKNARKGTIISEEVLSEVPRSQWWEIGLADEAAMAEVEAIGKQYEEAKKGLVLAINKWDLLEKDNFTATDYTTMVRRDLNFVDWAPLVFISAMTGQRAPRVLELADAVQFITVRAVRILVIYVIDMAVNQLLASNSPVPTAEPLIINLITLSVGSFYVVIFTGLPFGFIPVPHCRLRREQFSRH